MISHYIITKLILQFIYISFKKKYTITQYYYMYIITKMLSLSNYISTKYTIPNTTKQITIIQITSSGQAPFSETSVVCQEHFCHDTVWDAEI